MVMASDRGLPLVALWVTSGAHSTELGVEAMLTWFFPMRQELCYRQARCRLASRAAAGRVVRRLRTIVPRPTRVPNQVPVGRDHAW